MQLVTTNTAMAFSKTAALRVANNAPMALAGSQPTATQSKVSVRYWPHFLSAQPLPLWIPKDESQLSADRFNTREALLASLVGAS